jgi:hypothetical protein
VNDLREKLHAWRHDVAAEMPTPNPDFVPTAAPAPATPKPKTAAQARRALEAELLLADKSND